MRPPQDGCATPCESQGNISTRLSILGLSNCLPLPLRPRCNHSSSALPSLGYHTIPLQGSLPVFVNKPTSNYLECVFLSCCDCGPHTVSLSGYGSTSVSYMILLLRIRAQLHRFIFWTQPSACHSSE